MTLSPFSVATDHPLRVAEEIQVLIPIAEEKLRSCQTLVDLRHSEDCHAPRLLETTIPMAGTSDSCLVNRLQQQKAT